MSELNPQVPAAAPVSMPAETRPDETPPKAYEPAPVEHVLVPSMPGLPPIESVETEPIVMPEKTPPEEVDQNPAVGIPASARQAMEELPPDHNYRDRVVAQAKSYGIVVDDKMTLEYVLWLIQMKGGA